MADRLFEAMRGGVASRETSSLLRLPALREARTPETLTFSGGVSEYVYGREAENFGDLGPLLARAVEARTAQWGVPVEAPVEGIRATVVGASQYTIQVSGSTIFVMPLDACRCATSRSCARRCPRRGGRVGRRRRRRGALLRYGASICTRAKAPSRSAMAGPDPRRSRASTRSAAASRPRWLKSSPRPPSRAGRRRRRRRPRRDPLPRGGQATRIR